MIVHVYLSVFFCVQYSNIVRIINVYLNNLGKDKKKKSLCGLNKLYFILMSVNERLTSA